MKKAKIVMVAPAYNEEGKIGKLVKKKPKIIDTFVVVNDGSDDKTPKEAKAAGAHVITHKKRMGLGCAIRDGIKYGINNKYDIIVIIAGNGKDNPREVNRLLDPIIKEDYDYVQGSRYLKGGKTGGKMPTYRKIVTRLYPKMVWLATGFKATDATNGYRAYKSSIFKNKNIDVDQKWLDGTSFEFYLHIKVLKEKFKVKEVPVSKIYPKVFKVANYNSKDSYSKTRPWIDWWNIAKPIIFLTLKIKK